MNQLFYDLKRILLTKPLFWIEGRTVSIFYEPESNDYRVVYIQEDFSVLENVYTPDKIDDAIKFFLFLYNNDRISLTEEEINV